MKVDRILFASLRRHCQFCLHQRELKKYSTGPNKNNNPSKLYDDILQEARKYRYELREHAQSSFRHRYLAHSIHNINQVVAEMECKRQKMEPTMVAQIPSNVSIEILSNGTTHLSPSVFIRTPLKNYLFNCPEGTSRFLPSLRVRPGNTCDVFITQARWENIGGISGFLLAKEMNTNVQTRIHGPRQIKQYLECLRPFIDADFGSTKYPVSVEERTYDSESYEDAALNVSYIPLFVANASKSSIISNQMVDVAYLVQLKEPLLRIDILKIMRLKVPNGPLIGKLKAGEEVTLPDGRTIRPEDVQADVNHASDKPTILVLELDSDEKLESISNSAVLQDFRNGIRQLHYIVHFTPEHVLKGDAYSKWMKAFGDNCTHIVVNGRGAALPQSEGPYLHQILLNSLNNEIFPLLHPKNFRDVVLQDYDESNPGIVNANTMQRFAMRGALSKDDPIAIDLTTDELRERLSTSQNRQTCIDNFKKHCAELVPASIDPYPAIVFLGTASAVPSKYRNVSGYLLRLSETSNVLIDCGEGVYGQIRVLYGDDECHRIMVNLNVLLITHAHQDHMNGLYLIIIKRIEAFKCLGYEYRPLIVVCNRNVRKPMAIYSRNFDDIERFVKIVDVSMFMKSKSPLREVNFYSEENKLVSNGSKDYDQRVMIDLTLHLPESLYSAESWNLRQVKAVQVHHTRMANGFIFVDHKNGRKMVFSGDTMPCDVLVEQGRDADVLVHECTFEDGFEDDAFRKRHSTMGQALNVGRRMRAKNVILSHFSARYTRIPPLPDYLLEAGNVSVAMDNMVARFDYLPILPKLLPVFRELFAVELFDLQVKFSQRNLRKAASEQLPRKQHLAEAIFNSAGN